MDLPSMLVPLSMALMMAPASVVFTVPWVKLPLCLALCAFSLLFLPAAVRSFSD